jgi:hypothetical protein
MWGTQQSVKPRHGRINADLFEFALEAGVIHARQRTMRKLCRRRLFIRAAHGRGNGLTIIPSLLVEARAHSRAELGFQIAHKARKRIRHRVAVINNLPRALAHVVGTGHKAAHQILAQMLQVGIAANLVNAVTRCEVQLADGRLDIVVKTPGLYLVIENKVDAEEREDQCAYYSEHLPADARCILLSPDGRVARERSRDHDAETTNEFQPLRYAQLTTILQQALDDAKNSTSGRRTPVLSTMWSRTQLRRADLKLRRPF